MKTVEFKWEYPEKLEPAINYNGRYLILEGGRGSAKSHFIARRELIKRVNVRRDLICIREYQGSLKESNYKLIKELIIKYQLPYIIQADKFINKQNGAEIIFVGMNNLTADNIKSFEGFHDAWVEEAQNFSIHSAQLLLPTIRQPNSQITFTMNRKRVKDDIIDYVEKTYINRYLKIYINYLENPFLSDDARQEAEDCRNNKPDDWKRDWLGIPDDNFNKRVTKNFCNDNIADIIYQPSMHLHITCDFNKDPCCWELAHKGENVAFFFDEICLENTTVAKMCNEFINRYPNHTEDIIINGDASGKSSNVGMDAVFYAQMLNILRAKYGYKKVYLKIKKANPSTNERVESWNNMILTNKGERNVLISPKCKWLLYNIYNLEYKDGTSLINTPSINSLSKDPTLKFLGHPFDAASYMIDFYWSIKLNTLGYNPEKYVYKDPFFERLKNK